MQPHLAGHAGVCEIILDRPEVLNAINTAMATRLAQACAELAAESDSRAVVLSAAGDRAFCVGADLKERDRLSDAGLLAQREVFRAAFGGVLALPQPVIAAVHGYALGGGCELALSCDVIVADETAVFGLPETTVGLVPGGGGTQLALRRLGPGRAADLVLSGRRVDAGEAVDRAAFLAAHPDLAGGLAEFFAEADALDGLVGRTHSAPTPPSPADPEPLPREGDLLSTGY